MLLNKLHALTIFGSIAMVAQASIDLLVLGDWGNQGNIGNMMKVAASMDVWAASNGSSAVMALGDNFYKGGIYNYEGVQSTNDPKFTTLWQDVFNGTTLSTLPWWIILGNHDWYLNKSQQYEMLYQHVNWQITDFFYTKRIAVDASTYASFIFIETDLLFYGYNSTKNDLAANFALQGWNTSVHTIEKQLAWIDNALEQANKDAYVFVMGHHPTFTCGSDVVSSVDMVALDNLINKWDPTAYINGHHHTLAYYYVNNNATLQVQSGAGGTPADTACPPYQAAVGQELPSVNGFTHLRVTPSSATFDFVTLNNTVAFSVSMTPRKPVQASADTTYLPDVADPAVHFSGKPLPTTSTTAQTSTSTAHESSTTTELTSTYIYVAPTVAVTTTEATAGYVAPSNVYASSATVAAEFGSILAALAFFM
ncbi:Tartrate-resistant acid phosphatase type 5 [Entophlyctis luteolus]|nr:Tartrate-resistant acid phosphatase type 5 [Entophlyctis luteolus]KAJ3354842.1 Tartrate-resistant acid phosphatase type 5 [Entophlyctis luteolus]KAJ3393332.1 Tartrate-resistant acid phosphatase type 5 [Entophlyctis sp. JEL0112]